MKNAFNWWMRRPLSSNTWLTGWFYAYLMIVANNQINSFWVTPENPEGLTGFPGYALLAGLFSIGLWFSVQENKWALDLKRKTSSK